MSTQATTPATAQAAIEPVVYVTLPDGKQVKALTRNRMEQIIAGMEKKGKLLGARDNGRLIEGIQIIGDGTPFEGNLGLQFIYNVDLLSEVAYGGNKASDALDALNAALDAADGDLLTIHQACRSFLNAITVSFNVPTQRFSNGELVQARVDVITTEKGSLISLKNVSHQKAEKLSAKPTASFNLTAMLGARKAAKATELVDGAPAAEPQAPTAEGAVPAAAAVTAAANTQS